VFRALSFDLDDTLWPIGPTIVHAERSLQDWLLAEVPQIAAQWPVERMRALRDEMALRHPDIAHDYSEQRRRSLREVLSAQADCDQLVERAYTAFYAARNRVTLYDDATHSLERLAGRYRLASLSNGNADLAAIGLAHHFEHRISARDVGVMKPDAAIFVHLCQALDLRPHEIAHVGDDPDMDVVGAQRAGLFAIWLNREGRAWPHDVAPDLEVRDLHHLCAWLDAGANDLKE
jgi:FMN hydrolase / 5-amino-6-(5-phospho-D-ribitylamino)uracil phosphatase